jgi:cysteinyl-tRNA synthetase
VLRLHDTATGTVQPLDLRDPGNVAMYVCGSTVYDEPHIGHGRFALVWDVIRRYLAWSGLQVNFVSNVTDIDDKIIDRANKSGRTAAEVARFYEDKWWEAMDRLGVQRPTSEPHATEYVEDMVALIGQLIDRGHAYVGGDGVYFAAEGIADYGLLAHQPIDSLRVGARVAVDEEQGKRSPVDFALWKFAKQDEPSWESPWGAGRPGWHTECVVMALDLLGDGFDLHGGGFDLVFPHHENERAQAEAAGRPFARRWAHSGLVVLEDGEKMSKSLGNVVSLPDLLERYDPRAFRLLVLQSHYRSPMTVSDATMQSAQGGVERLEALARRFPDARIGTAPDTGALNRFSARMDNDLGTVQATAEMFELVKRANTLADEGRVDEARPFVGAVLEMCQAVGLDVGETSEEVSDAALALAAQRDEARKRGDYVTADGIRRQLQDDGWIVEDTPGGTVIRRSP